MFLDASAMVAILSAEPDGTTLIRCLEDAEAPITSALAIFETVAALSRKLKQDIAVSQSQVERFLQAAGVRLVPIAAAESRAALAAHARYGKGRGHPAQLNFGDCFAYACARVHDVPLLFIGDDFSRTDIRSAMA